MVISIASQNFRGFRNPRKPPKYAPGWEGITSTLQKEGKLFLWQTTYQPPDIAAPKEPYTDVQKFILNG